MDVDHNFNLSFPQALEFTSRKVKFDLSEYVGLRYVFSLALGLY